MIILSLTKVLITGVVVFLLITLLLVGIFHKPQRTTNH